jgi:hypothetical protein
VLNETYIYPKWSLSPLLLNFALKYAVRKGQETQVRLKLNGAHQLLAQADDVNLLGDNIDTIKKNTGTVIDASKEVGLEINVKKHRYICFVTRMQVKILNRSFENMSQVKILENTVTDQNLIQEEIIRRLNSGNAC